MSNSISDKGIYLGLKPIIDRWSGQLDSFQLYLVNYTDQSIDYNIECDPFFGYEGIVEANYALDLQILALIEFNKKRDFVLRHQGKQYVVSIKANKLKNQLVDIPTTNVQGYLFPFKTDKIVAQKKGRENEIVDLELSDIEKIKNAWHNQKVESNLKVQIQFDSEPVVDLHMEALDPHGMEKDPNRFLTFQLQQMEIELDSAIASGCRTIIFIHGIGNGTLKKAMFDVLEDHPHVHSYENRYDSRFGFGATHVVIK